MNKPQLIGITGGIGSGKSTICKIFSLLGTPVYESDSRAKWLMNNQLELKEELIKHFGKETYDEKLQLNRKHLTNQVFGDAEKVKLLNSIVHPSVGEDFRDWVSEQTNAPYVLNEAALLFESGRYLDLDKIITVFASEEIRLNRVLKRDQHRSKEATLAIMRKQMPEEEKLKKADFIIYNDDTQLLIPQVLKLHDIFINKTLAK